MPVIPSILYGDCTKVIRGQFNVVAYMPPWNMPRRYNGDERGYPDDQDEIDYQFQQVEKLKFMSTILAPCSVVVYHHRNRIKNRAYIVPEMWIFKQTELVLWDTVVLYKGSTQNVNKGRGFPLRETLYVFHRHGDNPKLIYSNPEPDELSDTHFDSRSDTWFLPPAFKPWHGTTHSSVAPEILPYRIFKRWCPPNGSVCDPNLGSGTSAIAAMKLGLRFTGAEIVHKYYLEALERVKEYEQSTKLNKIN